MRTSQYTLSSWEDAAGTDFWSDFEVPEKASDTNITDISKDCAVGGACWSGDSEWSRMISDDLFRTWSMSYSWRRRAECGLIFGACIVWLRNKRRACTATVVLHCYSVCVTKLWDPDSLQKWQIDVNCRSGNVVPLRLVAKGAQRVEGHGSTFCIHFVHRTWRAPLDFKFAVNKQSTTYVQSLWMQRPKTCARLNSSGFLWSEGLCGHHRKLLASPTAGELPLMQRDANSKFYVMLL